MIELSLPSVAPLNRISATLEDKEMGRGIVKAATLHLQGAMRNAQPTQRRLTRRSVYGSSFKSDKQRRYFFLALRKGWIVIPYQRSTARSSERFKDSWWARFEDDGLTGVVGNDTSYGHWLMGSDQSKFMAAMGWPLFGKVAKQEWPAIRRGAQAALRKYLDEKRSAK